MLMVENGGEEVFITLALGQDTSQKKDWTAVIKSDISIIVVNMWVIVVLDNLKQLTILLEPDQLFEALVSTRVSNENYWWNNISNAGKEGVLSRAIIAIVIPMGSLLCFS